MNNIKNKDMLILEKVKKSKQPLTSKVQIDNFTNYAQKCFDYKFTGESIFYPYNKPKNIPLNFNIGLIVGASGTGKSTLLKNFGKEQKIKWDNNKSIMSHFTTVNEAINKLSAVGLNSIPTWCKSYNVLSNGEKFRANLARKLDNNTVIDEFTSVVDRNVAKATSTAISKYIKKNNIKNVVFCTCHFDIIKWLEPNWIFDTNEGILYDGRLLRRPKIELKMFQVEKDIWKMFKDYHYLNANLNKSARTYAFLWNNEIVGFGSVLAFPNGAIKKGWRGHRMVILPDYQGMGIGTTALEMIADYYVSQGKKYYIRTAHIRYINYLKKNYKWNETTTSRRKRKMNQFINDKKSMNFDVKRNCASFEYIGKKNKLNKLKYGIYFQDNLFINYNKLKKYFNYIFKNVLKEKNLIFITGKVKMKDNLAEEYAEKYGIRTQPFPYKRINKNQTLKKQIDKIIIFYNNIDIYIKKIIIICKQDNININFVKIN